MYSVTKYNTFYYGSPIKTCNNCGKEFIDKYAVEIAVSGIKETSTKKTEPIYYFSLLIGVVFMLIGIVYPRGDINVTLITGIVFTALAVYIIVSDHNNYAEKQKSLKEEEQASFERLSDVSYAYKLKELGYDVPQKFLLSENSNVLKEKRIEKATGPIVKTTAKSNMTEQHCSTILTCPECHSILPSGSRFCYKCGIQIDK